jgi:hypothetical protein
VKSGGHGAAAYDFPTITKRAHTTTLDFQAVADRMKHISRALALMLVYFVLAVTCPGMMAGVTRGFVVGPRLRLVVRNKCGLGVSKAGRLTQKRSTQRNEWNRDQP